MTANGVNKSRNMFIANTPDTGKDYEYEGLFSLFSALVTILFIRIECFVQFFVDGNICARNYF